MSEVTFTIKATMEERWVNAFVSHLKQMERQGKIGKSAIVAFYADGDGDFRPNFEVDTAYKEVEPLIKREGNIFDAG